MNSNMTNEIIQLNPDIYNRWSEHLTRIDGQLISMWNFFNYNMFVDKEITNLNLQLTDLKNENSLLRLKRKIDCCDDEEEGNNKCHKIIPPLNILKSEYRSLYTKGKKKYKFMSMEERDKIALKIYCKIESIEDIIQLKQSPYKYDFIDCKKFTSLYNIIPCLEELNKIIGMKNVKIKIFNSICYFLHKINNSEEMNHCMIMGPPGVGKTTIAKIIASIYLKLGFLHNDTFIVAKRSDLIAKYLGQTAIKTQKVIDSAMGGVLFIDEVYSLGNSEKRDSFAKECIDTINLNMSRNDAPWLLIVGGYKDEIEKEFLAYNKGLERRFTVKLDIDPYTATEMYEILMKFVKEEMWVLEDDSIKVEDITKKLSLFKYFGGDMRKLLQLAKENYSVRNMKTSVRLDSNVKKLIREDFMKGIETFEKKENTDPFFHSSMYS